MGFYCPTPECLIKCQTAPDPILVKLHQPAGWCSLKTVCTRLVSIHQAGVTYCQSRMLPFP